MRPRLKPPLLGALAATCAASSAPLPAQMTRILPPTPSATAALGAAQGWRSGGVTLASYRWTLAADGRGMIELPGPVRAGGRRRIAARFILTPGEQARFAALITRAAAGAPSGGCPGEAPSDHIIWGGGNLSLDRNCDDADSRARLALLDDALLLLREAAARDTGA